MNVAQLPALLQPLLQGMACLLHARSAWRLGVLLVGLLFAQGRRRTVTTWIRAAHVQEDFPAFYYFLGSLARHTHLPASHLFCHLLRHLPGTGPILLALDDTPTKRYGPKVQGAGIHHNPTPGPADTPYLYGHVWVTLAVVVTHPQWGPTCLPIRALLYVRKKDIATIPPHYGWKFRTKLELAAELLGWAAEAAAILGRSVEIVVDGAYAKKPFLKAAAQKHVPVFSRLRRDAALRTLPHPRRVGQRGRPPTYGSGSIRLALRAGQRRGWQTAQAHQYGKARDKRIKTFEATWRPAGGRIRVVLVQEETGWLAYFSTDPSQTAERVLTAMAHRTTIEQVFHDLKEVEGLGEPQLRNIGANVSAVQLTLWEYVLVEYWAWEQPHEVLCDRSASPWDDAARRPSHGDRRNALQRLCVEQEFQRLCEEHPVEQEIQEFVFGLMKRAA
jgi:DDE superfamily endonuclease